MTCLHALLARGRSLLSALSTCVSELMYPSNCTLDLAKAPGAGTYSVPAPDAVDRKAPAYTMQGRTFMPSDQTKKPGPGAHSPENVTATLRRAPAYSLGGKHSEFITPLIIDVAD